MKKIFTYIKAFFSLGQLGVVIALLAATILFAAASQFLSSFDAAFAHMEVLNAIEGNVASSLADMQLNEARALFASNYELEEDGSAAKAREADQAIGAEFSRLAAEGRFSPETLYSSDINNKVDSFNIARKKHSGLVDERITAVAQDDDEISAEVEAAQEADFESLNKSLREMIIEVEHNRLDALQTFPGQVNTSILILAVAFGLCLALALMGYQAIAATVRPLRRLRNAITAISGDLYQPQNNRMSGSAGSLARALDELAQAEQQRNQASKADIERLRRELYESRRRRLKISRDTTSQEVRP